MRAYAVVAARGMVEVYEQRAEGAPRRAAKNHASSEIAVVYRRLPFLSSLE